MLLLLFAYNPCMRGISSSELRREISRRNMARAVDHAHEQTWGTVPSVIYQEEEGNHGNFLPASYRTICARPEWKKRLGKSYTGGKRVPRAWERNRCELDCANSSDALLMNVFCYPRLLWRPEICALFGIEAGLDPEFGFKPRIPLLNGRADRTEVDMRIGSTLVEAKLTETGFQTASTKLLYRYQDLQEVFDIADLPIVEDTVRSYQLIRGTLAAYAGKCSFVVLCDGRRQDLIRNWFEVMRAVRSFSFRNSLKLLTWQEIAVLVPPTLRQFLVRKYGITRG